MIILSREQVLYRYPKVNVTVKIIQEFNKFNSTVYPHSHPKEDDNLVHAADNNDVTATNDNPKEGDGKKNVKNS
ncbi:hypothetical protein DSUL_20259 [Desulfovibrionales bacterium]